MEQENITNFENKVALVTGGAQGIGWTTACLLSARGAQVVVCDLSTKIFKDAHKKSGLFDKSIILQPTDVSKENEVKSLFQMIENKFGKLDFVVNNAGIAEFGDPSSLSTSDWHKIIDVNLLSVFLTTANALPLMKKNNKGAIVNIGSIHGHLTTSGRAAYATSKTALIGATRSLALDLGPSNVRINLVSPGTIETNMLKTGWEEKAPGSDYNELKKKAESIHPCGRIGKPEDIAETVLFLLSECAGFITGSELIVDGGLHLKLAISSIWEE